MGNSGGRDRARQAAIAETARRNATSDANQERFRTGYDESYAGGKDERSNLLNAIYGGINGGGGGGAGQIRDAVSKIGNLFHGAEQPGSIDENISALTGIGKTGGIDPNYYDRIRGSGGFEEFAETGGISEENRRNIRSGYGDIAESLTGAYTPETLANIRSRSSSPISAIYDVDRNSLKRLRSVQGGYSPGHSASLARLSRSRGEAASNVARDTEIGIADLVESSRGTARDRRSDAERAIVGATQQGRQFGISGMSQIELALQQAIVGNKIAGASGGGALGIGKWQTAIQDAARRDAAARAKAALRLQGATSSAAAGRAGAAGRRASISQALALYGAQHGPTQSYIDGLLAEQGISGSQGLGGVSVRNEIERGGGGFDWSKLIGAIAGGAGAYRSIRGKNKDAEDEEDSEID